MGVDTSSVFREYILKIYDIGPIGCELGVARVQDITDNNIYDIRIKNSDMLKWVDLSPNEYKVIVYSGDISGARVKKYAMPDAADPYPMVGMAPVQLIYGEVLSKGVCTSPVMASPTHMTNDTALGNNVYHIYDRTIQAVQSDPEYTPGDVDQANARAVNQAGISTGSAGIMIQHGPSAISVGQKSGAVNSAEHNTTATQEHDHGSGMLTTSYNFLHHYMIGLANAVALPMPHMVNLVKMIAIGSFVKTVIGAKNPPTGIYGLADQITNTVNGNVPAK